MTKPTLVQRLGARMAGAYHPQTIADMDRLMDAAIGGYGASSGALVSGSTAVNFSAFFSGVFQICQTIASCRTTLYKESGDFVKNPWKTHPVYGLLTRKSNDFMNAFTWKERMQYHAMVWGNGYSFIQRDSGLRPVALWPLNPERVTPKIIENNGQNARLVYIFRDINGKEIEYAQDQIFHLTGFGFDSVKGYSLLEIARETIGLGLSQQEFSGKFLSNGAHLGGILNVKKAIGEQAKKTLRERFSDMYSGVANSGKFAVVESEELSYTPLGMPLADAQFLESKIFQLGEIARILNISPYKLKDYSHATFSNIEHLGIEYATDTIRPWAERWEAAIDTQLLTDSESSRGFAEFDLASIQRGDMKTMNEAYNSARNGGWMNADEIRYRQSMNPIEDKKVGKTYWRPKNMGDAALDDPEPVVNQPVDPVEPDEDDKKEQSEPSNQTPVVVNLAVGEGAHTGPGKMIKKTVAFERGVDNEIVNAVVTEEWADGK
jgi:HK97 family phage portal protein